MEAAKEEELFKLSLAQKKELISRGNQMLDCLKGLPSEMVMASLVLLIDTFERTYGINLRKIRVDTGCKPVKPVLPLGSNTTDSSPIQSISKLRIGGVISS